MNNKSTKVARTKAALAGDRVSESPVSMYRYPDVAERAHTTSPDHDHQKRAMVSNSSNVWESYVDAILIQH